LGAPRPLVRGHSPRDPVGVRGEGRRGYSVSLPQPAPLVVPVPVPVVVEIEVELIEIIVTTAVVPRGARVTEAAMAVRLCMASDVNDPWAGRQMIFTGWI